MRQIKFRAWNKEKRIMVYENEDISSCYWDGVDCSDIEMVNFRLMNDEYVWMQYTGLEDKNGKEIYEGDIIKYNFKSLLDKEGINRERIAPVYWQEFRGGWSVKDSRFCNSDLFTYVQNGNVAEVIGNIYKNPELLK